MGEGNNCCLMPRSAEMCWRYRRNIVHLSVAYISASAELLAVIAWCLETQWIGPPYQMTYPERDLVLKRSRGGEVVLGLD